jgi:hypothetical protein
MLTVDISSGSVDHDILRRQEAEKNGQFHPNDPYWRSEIEQATLSRSSYTIHPHNLISASYISDAVILTLSFIWRMLLYLGSFLCYWMYWKIQHWAHSTIHIHHQKTRTIINWRTENASTWWRKANQVIAPAHGHVHDTIMWWSASLVKSDSSNRIKKRPFEYVNKMKANRMGQNLSQPADGATKENHVLWVNVTINEREGQRRGSGSVWG